MPNYVDDFALIVVASTAATIEFSAETTVGSGSQFLLEFNYNGGYRPAATSFSVAFYATESDLQAGTNPISGADAPSQLQFSPVTPLPGPGVRSGQLSGRAPTLANLVTTKTLHTRATIYQAALEN